MKNKKRDRCYACRGRVGKVIVGGVCQECEAARREFRRVFTSFVRKQLGVKVYTTPEIARAS